jgi:hypothetical protein
MRAGGLQYFSVPRSQGRLRSSIATTYKHEIDAGDFFIFYYWVEKEVIRVHDSSFFKIVIQDGKIREKKRIPVVLGHSFPSSRLCSPELLLRTFPKSCEIPFILFLDNMRAFWWNMRAQDALLSQLIGSPSPYMLLSVAQFIHHWRRIQTGPIKNCFTLVHFPSPENQGSSFYY